MQPGTRLHHRARSQQFSAQRIEHLALQLPMGQASQAVAFDPGEVRRAFMFKCQCLQDLGLQGRPAPSAGLGL
jgi:hypothetical protein